MKVNLIITKIKKHISNFNDLEDIMPTDFYCIDVDGHQVAENVPLEYVMIFVKAIYVEFYNEPNLKVSIERMYNSQQDTEG